MVVAVGMAEAIVAAMAAVATAAALVADPHRYQK
jgi:hypothetical protein